MEFSEAGGSRLLSANLHGVMFKWRGLPARCRQLHKVLNVCAGDSAALYTPVVPVVC